MDTQKTGRLRQHPRPRFEGSQHYFVLDEVAAVLKHEVEAGEAGRRQETLYKRGGTSISLFVFGRLTRLSKHRANGVVMIQVISGNMQVNAEGKTHDLKPGNLLVLAPGVEHDVTARTESQMLLTVSLENPLDSK